MHIANLLLVFICIGLSWSSSEKSSYTYNNNNNYNHNHNHTYNMQTSKTRVCLGPGYNIIYSHIGIFCDDCDEVFFKSVRP